MRYTLTITTRERTEIDAALNGQKWHWLVQRLWEDVKYQEDMSGQDVRSLIADLADAEGLVLWD